MVCLLMGSSRGSLACGKPGSSGRPRRSASAGVPCRGRRPPRFRAYEACRLPPTSELVLSNRRHGPEVVMQMAEERAPGGFDDIRAVFAPNELEQVANRYKTIAGFDREHLNAAEGYLGT